MKKYIPSSITLLNLVCGFIAIILEEPVASAAFIFMGAFMDLIDGLLARKLNATSSFGKELDSLADVVTFGVAPAYLYYFILMPENVWSVIVVALLPVASAVRLAKFNTDDSQSKGFKGLPTPANAIFFASLVLLYAVDTNDLFSNCIQNTFVVYGLPVLFSFLMLSNIKMFSLKALSEGFKKNIVIYLYFLSVVVSFVFLGYAAIPLSIVLYVVFSVVFYNSNAICSGSSNSDLA